MQHTKSPSFKASVALSLLGVEQLNTQRLQRLSGRTPATSKSRIQYTPQDMLKIRARLANIEPEAVFAAMAKNTKLPRIIVTRMTKGGVGKTSITVNLATTLAMLGYRVLLIDADPQASATNMLGVPTEEMHLHIGTLMLQTSNKPDDLREYIIPIFEGGFLDLLPSDVDLDSTNPMLLGTMGREQKAVDVVMRNKDFLSKNYDVILVDTNPSTTPVSVALTYLAHLTGKILTVVEPEGSCLRALDSLKFNLDEVQKLAKTPINLAILVNKSQIGRKQSDKNMALLQTTYPNAVMQTYVQQAIAFTRQVDADDILNSEPVVLREATSKAAENMHQVAKIIISEFSITQPGFPVVQE